MWVYNDYQTEAELTSSSCVSLQLPTMHFYLLSIKFKIHENTDRSYSMCFSQRAFMKYRLPLREIVVDFYNELKSITSGYASFDYEDAG